VSELQPGTVLRGKYCVERLIAEGGMSRCTGAIRCRGRAGGHQAARSAELAREDVEQFQKEYDILPARWSTRGWHSARLLRGRRPALSGRGVRAGREPGGCIKRSDGSPSTSGRCHRAVARSSPLPPPWPGDLPGPQALQRHPASAPSTGEAPAGSPEWTARLVDFGAARMWKATAAVDTVPLGTPDSPHRSSRQGAERRALGRLRRRGAAALYVDGVPARSGAGVEFEAPHEMVPGIPRALGWRAQGGRGAAERRFPDAADMRRAVSMRWGAGAVVRVRGDEAGRRALLRCAKPPVRSSLSCVLAAGVVFAWRCTSRPLHAGTRTRTVRACKCNLKTIARRSRCTARTIRSLSQDPQATPAGLPQGHPDLPGRSHRHLLGRLHHVRKT